MGSRENETPKLPCEDKEIKKLESDMAKLYKQKEAAEKEACHFKEHYLKLKNDMDELFKMVAESSQNKKDLKNIIEQKNKIIKELKHTEVNGLLKDELLNATEKLAQEKKQCFKLQEKLRKVTDELQLCNEEKYDLMQKLDKIQNDIKRYEDLQDRLVIMVEKQENLEEIFKNHEQALYESNFQKKAFELQFKEAQKLLHQKDIEQKIAKNNVNCKKLEDNHQKEDLEIIKSELASCKEKNEKLLRLLHDKDRIECELKRSLEKLKTDFHRSGSFTASDTDQVKISDFCSQIENYKSENLKLRKEVDYLNTRISNIETIARDLRDQIAEKDKTLGDKIKENSELQDKICSMSFEQDTDQLLRQKLHTDFMEKERILKSSADEKLKNLLEQLNEAREELHDCLRKHHTMKAETNASLVTLENKISLQEQEILQINDEKHDLKEKLKYVSINRIHSDANIDTLKKKLTMVTSERDEKIEVIQNLKKMSQQMQAFADESRLEQQRLYAENDLLREKSYDAQCKLQTYTAEQDSQQVEIEKLQQKLITLEKTFNLEKIKMKQMESILQEQLMEAQTECRESFAEKNKILNEKEMAIKNLRECEKRLQISNHELGQNNSELKKLQKEHDKLETKLKKYRENIEQFNTETDKLLLEQKQYDIKTSELKNNIEILEQNISEKDATIAKLTSNSNTQNISLQQTQNECTALQKVKTKLCQRNSELKESCSSLENDIKCLRKELKTESKNISTLKEKNKSLENSLREVENENLLLKSAFDECVKLEKDKEMLHEKCNNLSTSSGKLEADLRNMRNELIQSKEMKYEMEKQVDCLKKSEKEWKEKCSFLSINNNKLNLELEQEKRLHQETDKKIEQLQDSKNSFFSDKEILLHEKIKTSNELLLAKDKQIDNMLSVNAELERKCRDHDEKELLYTEQIQQASNTAKISMEEYAKLRNKYESLGPKLGKYVMQYKNIKQSNADLENTITKKNILLQNLEKENIEMKEHCKNVEQEMSIIKEKKLKLWEELNSLKCQTDKKQNELSQSVEAATKITRKRKVISKTDDPVIILDTLVSRVKKSSSPAATHLVKSCKHIRELIIKERGDSNVQTEL